MYFFIPISNFHQIIFLQLRAWSIPHYYDSTPFYLLKVSANSILMYPSSKRFHCCILDPRKSVLYFGKSKSRTRLFWILRCKGIDASKGTDLMVGLSTLFFFFNLKKYINIQPTKCPRKWSKHNYSYTV